VGVNALYIYVGIVTALILAPSPTGAENTKQSLRVIDGDTIVINNTRHRFSGIDAPEKNQHCLRPKVIRWACGKAATEALKIFLENRAVSCLSTGKDRFKRFLSTCFTGPININAWIVRNGWALAYRHYSKKYVNEENLARSNMTGIWSSHFIKPWEWRRGKRLTHNIPLQTTNNRKGAPHGP
jgi:endonuclease YncB( thermonuclease family)